jgi:hypothetical protein
MTTLYHLRIAIKVRQTLFDLARNRRTVSYNAMSNMLGLGPGGHRSLIPALGIIRDACEAQDIPNLAVLVVRGDTKLPGEGPVLTEQEWREQIDAVFNFDWTDVKLTTTLQITI